MHTMLRRDDYTTKLANATFQSGLDHLKLAGELFRVGFIDLLALIIPV